MISGDYTIRIRCLENGYMVEVPDMEKIKEKEAQDKKKGSGSYPTYIGDLTESYAAKTVGEVLKLVKQCLAGLPDPEVEYAQTFAEAAKDMPATRG